ncbi:MAG: hypothetical protein F4Z51_08655 [Chloroflexi bacterium]|nr:hypothetical protein [Chloroflexota bacterium]
MLAGIVAQDGQAVSTEVRINARLLTDGRVEFAIQQRDGDGWGDRKIVTSRFLNTRTAARNAWVASDPYPIEVTVPAGADMGLVGQSSGPPDWRPIESTVGKATGDFSTMQERGRDWQVWQMHHAGGPDAYVACRQGSREVHAKTEGGEWGASNAQGLLELFDFAPWHYTVQALQPIGRFCNVMVSHLINALIPRSGGQQQRTTTTEPTTPTAREPITEVTTGIALRTGKLINHQVHIRYHSHDTSRWSVSARTSFGRGLYLLKAGSVSVTVGGRTFSFQIAQHPHGPDTSGAVSGPGTEAALSGTQAHAFYCAAKDKTVSISLPTTHDGVHAMSVYIRGFSIDGVDPCE